MDRGADNNSGSRANLPGASSRVHAPVSLATNDLRFTEDFDVELFHHGPILHHVQVSDVLHDGKEFVDRPALFSPYTIQSRWNKLVEIKGIPSNEEIKAFVEENFGDSGWELVPVNSNDLDTEPSYIDTLQNEGLIRLAKEIQELWFDLGKQVRPQVKSLGKRTSLLYVPNMFVIPGGRFKEVYYWDTYWIVKALLRSNDIQTAKGIIENYFYLIKHHGFIPNGTRSYYLDRSQPPLLIFMVKDYIDFSGDKTILEDIDFLIQEMKWFEKNRSVEVIHPTGTYYMFRYDTNGYGPRPESYKEDLEIIEHAGLDTEEEKAELFKHIRAGAESGWDFSCRWIIDSEGGCNGGLENIRTRFIIPVDLNSIMYKNYTVLSNLLSMLDRDLESDVYLHKANTLREAVMQVNFNTETKTWRDYDILNNKQRDFFFASNICPLWTNCYPEDRAVELGDAAAKYLVDVGAVCPGGLITSLKKTGLQWDAPNVWPPMQEMAVTGLRNTGGLEASRVAYNIASNFTINALGACTDDQCTLFEKYDAMGAGTSGGGGEYEVQTGFGWTNGVLVEFMILYGDQILPSNYETKLNLEKVRAPGFNCIKYSGVPPVNQEKIDKTLSSLNIK